MAIAQPPNAFLAGFWLCSDEVLVPGRKNFVQAQQGHLQPSIPVLSIPF